MNLENFPTSDAANRMLSYVTKGWYDNSYIGKWTYQVMGLELDEARERFEEFPYQLFPETATWGLRYHEMKYGLDIREDLSVEERRALIIEKRDSKYSMTPYRMESILFERFGAEVHVNDTNDPAGYVFEHPNIFSVLFVQDGNEYGIDLQVARKLIQKLKLSHTTYMLRYKHLIWVNQDIDYELNMSAHTSAEVDTKPILGIPEMSISTGVNSNITCGADIRVYKNFWRMDGTYNLDGERLLNAEEHIIEI